jgi:predicted DNA-binding transcriptional regulator YafY
MSIELNILSAIGHGSLCTAEQVRGHLQNAGIERDIRSVQRTLQTLVDAGELICMKDSKPYGYKRSWGAQSLAMATLNPAEAMVLLLAQKYLKNVLPSSLNSIFEPYFSEARVVLSSEKSNATLSKQWLQKVRLIPATQPLLPPKVDLQVLETLSAALYSNHEVDIRYKSINGKVAEHRIRPLGIVQQGVRLYLVGNKTKYEKPMPWAIHRITEATETSFGFTRPAGFDLKKFEDDGSLNWGLGQKVKVSFWMAKTAALNLIETPLSNDQKHIQEAEGYRFSATVTDSKLLSLWIQSFGEDVRDFSKVI